MGHEQGLAIANQELLATGLFANIGDCGGLYGYVPVQFEAQLATGEVLGFKSRGVRCSLTINDGKTVFMFVHTFRCVKYGYAGWLEGSRCKDFILRWIAEYRAGSFPNAQTAEMEDGCIILRSSERIEQHD